MPHPFGPRQLVDLSSHDVSRALVRRQPAPGLEVGLEEPAEPDQVGVTCDSETGGENAARALARLTDFCTLGVARWACLYTKA